jgi:hypothetical protein
MWQKSILSGEGYLQEAEIKNMFTGPDIDYDIETCHMVS